MKWFAVFLSIASFLLCGCAPQHRIEGLYSSKYVTPFGDMIIFYPDNSYLIENNFRTSDAEIGTWRVRNDSIYLSPKYWKSCIGNTGLSPIPPEYRAYFSARPHYHPEPLDMDFYYNVVFQPHPLDTVSLPFRILSSRKIEIGGKKKGDIDIIRRRRRGSVLGWYVYKRSRVRIVLHSRTRNREMEEYSNYRVPAERISMVRERRGGFLEVSTTIDTLKQGYAARYDSLGRLRVELCYIDGDINGPFVVYDTVGRVSMEGHYYKEYYIKNVRVYAPDGSSWLVDPDKEPLKDWLRPERQNRNKKLQATTDNQTASKDKEL